MRARLILALLLAFPHAPAQQTRCTLAGTAIDFMTGEPLRKTTVWLFSWSNSLHPSYQGATDGSGTFRFTEIPAGHYTLTGQHSGYTESTITLNLQAGDKLTGLTLKLTRGSSISGKVIDDTGSPAAKALVQAVSQQWLRGERIFDESHSSWTNDAGEFRISDLPPGRYYLCAGKSSDVFVEKQGGPEMDSLETCYPDARTLDGATQLDIRAGLDVHGIDMKLPVGPVFHIRGTIIGSAKPEPEQELSLQAHLHGFYDLFELDEEDAQSGKFAFSGAAPGVYDVELIGERREVVSTTTVEIKKSDVTNVVLTVPPTLTLRGTVRSIDDDGTTVYRGQVIAFDVNSPLMTGPYSAEIASDGTFEFKDLWPGRYVFQVDGSGDADAYMKSIEYGGHETLGIPVTLTSSGGKLAITLSKGAARIAGSITPADSEGKVSGLQVVLTPDPPCSYSFCSLFLTADQNGHFTFAHVPPGKYYVFAVDADAGVLPNEDFTAQLAPTALEIEVPEGADLQIKVPRIPADDVQRAIASISR